MATPTTLPASFVSGAVLTAAQMNNLRGAFRVLQVLQDTKLDTFSTTSTTYTDVTGLSIAITPSDTNSKILVIAQVNISTSTTNQQSAHIQLAGGNSGTYVGDAASNRVRAAASTHNFWSEYYASAVPISTSIVYLDSPATTSATTYKVQMRVSSNTITGYVNQSGVDTDSAVYARVPSSITVMEISA